jgi:hypothetical protein
MPRLHTAAAVKNKSLLPPMRVVSTIRPDLLRGFFAVLA